MIRILLPCPSCRRLCTYPSAGIRAGEKLTCPECWSQFTCDSNILHRAVRQLEARKLRTARIR